MIPNRLGTAYYIAAGFYDYMENACSDPIEEAIETIQGRWTDRTDAFARVFNTILEWTEYRHYSTVAEKANCSENTAKKHLDRLVDMGIVDRNDRVKLATYRRSRPYLEWWLAQDIAAGYSREEIIEQIEVLEEYQKGLEDQFDEADLTPNKIYMAESVTLVSEQLDAVTKWRYTEQWIRYHQFAYQISRFDGHFIPRIEQNTRPRISEIPD